MPAERTSAAAVAERLRGGLPAGWRVAVATAGCRPDTLTAGELAQYARLTAAGPRRRTWLLGRQALRKLLTGLGEPPDTSVLRFPHPRLSLSHLSLSHTGDLAVAAAAPATATGAGIDAEAVDRAGAANERTARFFLLPDEAAWLGAQPTARRPEHLLRLWTVKEAAFKANLANHGTGLHQYRLADCGADQGFAAGPAPAAGSDYRTTYAAGFVVTTATARRPS